MIANKDKKSVNIILQPRLGDAILSLPAILCLQQLNIKYNRNLDIKIISTFPGLVKVIRAFNMSKTNQISILKKTISWICPADKAFFLAPTTKNWGFKAKETYGLFNPFRGYVKYTHEAEYIAFDRIDKLFPSELIKYLKENYGFSTITISIFGICLDLGFTSEQIIDTFKFNTDIFSLKKDLTNWKPPLKQNSYIVFCMEAANNKKVDEDRRWNEGNYLNIAEEMYQNYELKSVFIGLSNKFLIPEKPYFIDFRRKLNLIKLAQLLRLSKGYIGNDTGPLHLCNLMQKTSIGIYLRESTTKNFSPIFPQLNKVILKPENTDEIFSQIKFLLS